MAVVYDTLGEYNQAKELHEKVLTIRKKIFGGDHADVATSYNNLALVYQQLGDHADVAISYNNLVSVYSCLGQYNQAKELYEKALTIRKQIFGEDHKYVERIRSELALVELDKHLVSSGAEDRSARESMLLDPINCFHW